MRSSTPPLGTRLLAALTVWCVLQAWVWAPMADAAIDHDPTLRAGCPTQTHIETSPDAHGVQGCLIQIAAHLVSGPAAQPAITQWVAAGAALPRLADASPIRAATDSRQPPSRAPPVRA